MTIMFGFYLNHYYKILPTSVDIKVGKNSEKGSTSTQVDDIAYSKLMANLASV